MALEIPNQIDNYSVTGMANGIVDLFATVAANLQVKYGNTSVAWANVINDLDDIIYADHIRSLNLDSTDTVAFESKDIAEKRSLFVDRQSVDYLTTPSSINDTTGNLVKYYQVLVREKEFSNTYVTSNVGVLNNFISNTLDANPIYSNLAVTSSRQYAVDNNFVSDYTGLTDASFDPYSITKELQDAAEYRIATVKTVLLNSKVVN